MPASGPASAVASASARLLLEYAAEPSPPAP